ncbi:MAG: hypothetical protein M1823_006871, partial [Watsoniomyces obsoletus]
LEAYGRSRHQADPQGKPTVRSERGPVSREACDSRCASEDADDEDAAIEAELAAERAAAMPAAAVGLAEPFAEAVPAARAVASGANPTGRVVPPTLELSPAEPDEDEPAEAPAAVEFEPAPRLGAGVGLSVAASLATPAAAALPVAAVAAVPLAASGPAFSIEMPVAEPEVAPSVPASTIPTPLSLADLADGDLPPRAAVPAPRTLEITTPGRDDLDPNAGADIAAVADEDEDADAMPPGNYDPTLEL